MAYYDFTKRIIEGKSIQVFNYGKMKRDFTYIDDSKKRYGYRGTACIGANDVLSPYPDLLSKSGYWHFYDYYPTQIGSSPIKLDYLMLQFSPQTPDIRTKLYKFQ